MVVRILYAILAMLIIGGYAYAGFTGGEMRRTRSGYAPPEGRGTQGASRAFWYGGYRGGK
ncbi:MAG TPA: hypothetical protein VEK79_24815 [Thermoanaerobaculia bacterium]|nr:hypothetical protein [Thermoanaerobaculia bacterium]